MGRLRAPMITRVHITHTRSRPRTTTQTHTPSTLVLRTTTHTQNALALLMGALEPT